LRQPPEILVADFPEELFLVGKVLVNGGWRVFDFVGDFAHRDAVKAFLDEQLASGIEDLLSGLAAFALAPFFDSNNSGHFLNIVILTPLQYCTVLSLSRETCVKGV
jgi:hypothetical protein